MITTNGQHQNNYTKPTGFSGRFSKPQQKFLLSLFSTLIIACGRATFTNLSRYSQLNERTYRRQYQRSFNFIKFNGELIQQAIEPQSQTILAVDCSFIAKSGKQTYGLDYFYNGSAAHTEKGLEISAMAVVDVTNKIGYSLSERANPSYSTSQNNL
jgi:hypothetical protein